MTEVVIFGGTGDLSRRYLVPALQKILEKGEDLNVYALGRRFDSQEDFLEEFKISKDFSEKIYYHRLDFRSDEDYKKLNERLNDDHRIFYLATLPDFFRTITEALKKNSLLTEKSKVLYEKPFGKSLEHARELDTYLREEIGEERIYRIDHYLNKEIVWSIPTFRFTNILLEPQWNNTYVDHVQIIMTEEVKVNERMKYYDEYGELKDFQSHLLQVLSLVAMEEPEKFEDNEIRDKKVEVLGNVRIEDCIFGQYKGYKENSDTETLAALKIKIDTPRWEGVPFYLVTGKNMDKKITDVFVKFKNLPCKIFDGVCPLTENSIDISIYPESKISITINTKEAGSVMSVPSSLTYNHEERFEHVPSAHENLFRAAIKGDQSSFVREDEVEKQWEIVEGVCKKELFEYEPGTFPEEVKEFISKDGRKWNL